MLIEAASRGVRLMPQSFRRFDGMQFRRIFPLPPGVYPAEQRSDAAETLALQGLSAAGAGDFIRTGTIHNDVPVMWKLMVAHFNVAQIKMDRSLNDGTILCQLRTGTEINDDQIFAGIEFLAQLGHGDPRCPQFAQHPWRCQYLKAMYNNASPTSRLKALPPTWAMATPICLI